MGEENKPPPDHSFAVVVIGLFLIFIAGWQIFNQKTFPLLPPQGDLLNVFGYKIGSALLAIAGALLILVAVLA